MKRLSFAFAVCLLAAAGYAGARSRHWTQIDEEDGIRVWRLDVPGQDLPGFRGQTRMQAPLSRIVETLQNVSEHPEWMYRCAEAKALRRFGEHHAVVYNRTDVPWPIWDRDVILGPVMK
jgi:hypothetical protein